MKKTLACLSGLCLALALSGCISDGAAYFIDGNQGGGSLSVTREQDYFWQKKVRLFVVVARLPSCQRRHPLATAPEKAPITLWQPGENTYIFQVGKAMFVAETRTCEGFARLDEAPPGGLGTKLGVFHEVGGAFAFTPAPKAAAPAEPATPAAAHQGP
jgi:hypothetical protein